MGVPPFHGKMYLFGYFTLFDRISQRRIASAAIEKQAALCYIFSKKNIGGCHDKAAQFF